MEILTPAVIPERLRERFELAFKYKKVICFHAPCGFGKTTAARELLKNQNAVFVDGTDCTELPETEGDAVLVIDDLQSMEAPLLLEELCHRIRTGGNQRFVLLSRGAIPGCLTPFLLAGVMEVMEVQDMVFDRNCIRRLAAERDIPLSGSDVDALLADTQGFPVQIVLTLPLIRKQGAYNSRAAGEGRQQLYAYFDERVYRLLPKASRRLLLELSPFEQVSIGLARMVSGENNAGELLTRLRECSSMFLAEKPEVFRLHPIFRSFLLWKLSAELSPEEEKAIFLRAGLHYELRGEMKYALDCYAQIGDYRKISELLQKNAELHVGIGHYLDMEKYYFAMPKEEILKSPTLMAGMSMLCSLFMDYEQSEEWYSALKQAAGSLPKSDPKYQEAKSRLAYLDIALPQRGTAGLLDIIKSAFRLLSRRELTLPGLSVTSTIPSIINGGKDFCLWTKQDDLLYPTIKKPVEGILGRDGVGLIDIGMCESKFEKNEDYQPWLLNLAGRLSQIQKDGTPDIEFAAVGLLARVQTMQGHAEAAVDALNAFRERLRDLDEERFLPNLEALLCRIYLRQGSRTEVKRWLAEKAPADDLRIWVLYRYQYFTKAMVLMAGGDCGSALIILNRLLPYTKKCGRVMDEIYVHLLSAICHYRLKNDLWQAELSLGLDRTQEYGFITPVSQYGRAILPLLTHSGWDKDQAYLKKLIEETRTQAAFYPLFLQAESKLSEPLTTAEQQVLQLLCRNISNQEICEILGIKLATVKTHVSHIFQKLGIKSRMEVKAAAEENGLI